MWCRSFRSKGRGDTGEPHHGEGRVEIEERGFYVFIEKVSIIA
jgi:hypothetical protein